MTGVFKVFKKTMIIFLCLPLLLTSCTKQNTIADGIVWELYIDQSSINFVDTNYPLYHIQNKTIINFGKYRPCYNGGTPVHVRDRVGSYYKTDGHGMYKEGYGQLDDYHIGEDFEAYLYVSNNVSDLMYYKAGKLQTIDIPNDIEFRQMQYRNGSLYLIGQSLRSGQAPFTINVLKINISSNATELLQYRTPYYQSIVPASGDALCLIVGDDILLTNYSIAPSFNSVICISYPNEKYKEIPISDSSNAKARLLFETEDGFACLKTVASKEDLTSEDFFLSLHRFDFQGNQTTSQTIDCSQIRSKIKGTFLLQDGAAFYKNILYLPIVTYDIEPITYIFEYDTAKQQMMFCGNVKGRPVEAQLVQYKNGYPYSAS